MFEPALRHPLLAAALSLGLAAPASSPADALATYAVTIAPATGAPVEIAAAAVRVRPSRNRLLARDQEAVHEVTLRNVSGKKVTRVEVRWTALDAPGSPLGDQRVTYLPERPLRRGKTLEQLSPAPDPPAAIDHYSARVVQVVFADRTVWSDVRREESVLERAESRDVRAWLVLGLMYRDGRDAHRDPIRAYAWLHLAAVAGSSEAAEQRDELATAMTPEEIDEAERLSRDIGLDFFQQSLE